jgi:glutathione S-transferase
MTTTLHYASGSPYAWRVWLALEHKGVPYELKTLSFDAGDLKTPEFLALNPRHRVPVLVDDGFALYESAAIVEYVEDRWPDAPRLFSADLRERAVQRRLIREADQYVVEPLERLVTAVLFTKPEERKPETIARACGELREELAFWESATARDHLAGPVSAADYTLYASSRSCSAWRAATPASSRRILPARTSPPGCTAWRRCRSCKGLGRRIGGEPPCLRRGSGPRP